MTAKSNRRQFIKKTALTTGGVGSLLAATSPIALAAGAEDSGSAALGKTHYCIVGAGYAGLTAAFRLMQAGYAVTVLEARSRFGGRIFSERFSDGTPIDLGGAWVSTSQPGIMKLIQEFGIQTYVQYDRGKNTFLRQDGQVFYYDAIPTLVDAVGLEAIVDLGAAIEKLNALAGALDPEAAWADVDLPLLGAGKTSRDADSISVGVWIDANMSTDMGKLLMRTVWTGIFAHDPRSVSFLHLLFQLSTSPERTLQQFVGSGPGEAENMRVFGGAEAAAKAMARQLGDSIVLNAPVKEIIQEGNVVRVVSDRGTVRARRVIVAIPTALMNYIRFDPPLPGNRAQLQQRVPGGSIWKIWLVYDHAFWRQPREGSPEGLTGESLAPGSIVPITIDAGRAEGKDAPGLLNAFVVGDDARRIAAMTPQARRQLIIGEIVKRFGPEAANLSKNIVYPRTNQPYVEKCWSQQEWTYGAYAGLPGPGVITGEGFGPALRAPVGRVHWAGADTATRWYGAMDGAVQSGERAAAEVIAAPF